MHPKLFKAKTEPELLDVPELNYLAIRGNEKPGGTEFQAAIGALYQCAFTMKFQWQGGGQGLLCHGTGR